MATLSEQERKRIQRYCIYPKIAGAALAMAFVLPFLIIPFEMIDDIVFHHESFQETGMMTALALTAVELAIFCYCALALWHARQAVERNAAPTRRRAG